MTAKKTVEDSSFKCRSIEELRFLYISTVRALLELDLKEREEKNHCIVFDLKGRDDKKEYIGVKPTNFDQVLGLYEKRYAEVHGEKPISILNIKRDFRALGMMEPGTRVMNDKSTGTGSTKVTAIKLENFFMWNNIPLLHVDTMAEMLNENHTYIKEWIEQQSRLKLE